MERASVMRKGDQLEISHISRTEMRRDQLKISNTATREERKIEVFGSVRKR
jgi:hypothetical protein